MYRITVALLAVVLGIGCGDDGGRPNRADAQTVDMEVDAFVAGPDDGARSGTRLKLRWYVFADGAKHLARMVPAPGSDIPVPGLYDAVLGVNCTMTLWSDGTSYCTPVFRDTYTAYADPGCTLPATNGSPDTTCGPAISHVATMTTTTGCGSLPGPKAIARLYKAVAQPAGSQIYVKESNGVCASYGVPPGGQLVYAAGEEVPVSALAQITTTGLLGDDPLKPRYHQSADGFQMQADTLTDTSTGIECVPEDFFAEGRATARCGRYLPNFRTGYAGTGCTTAVTTASACVSSTAIFMESDICARDHDPTDKFWRLGTEQLPASCGLSPGTYQTLEPITLPQMTRTRDASGGHRIQPIRDTSGGFSRIDRTFMYDSMLDTECQIVGNQCFPINTYIRPTRYSDSACTQVLDVQDHYPGGACSAPLSKYAVKLGGCIQITEIATVGAVYTGPIYELSGSVCVPTTTGTYYSLGAWQSGSTVATVVLQNDP